MKFYLLIIFSLFLSVQLSLGQTKTLDPSKSDVPKLSTESLRIETEIDIYPNPTVEFVNISLKNSTLEKVEIEVYNIIGNKVDLDIEQTRSNNYKANVKDLLSGYYLVIIKDPVTRFNKAYKFRKQ